MAAGVVATGLMLGVGAADAGGPGFRGRVGEPAGAGGDDGVRAGVGGGQGGGAACEGLGDGEAVGLVGRGGGEEIGGGEQVPLAAARQVAREGRLHAGQGSGFALQLFEAGGAAHVGGGSCDRDGELVGGRGGFALDSGQCAEQQLDPFFGADPGERRDQEAVAVDAERVQRFGPLIAARRVGVSDYAPGDHPGSSSDAAAGVAGGQRVGERMRGDDAGIGEARGRGFLAPYQAGDLRGRGGQTEPLRDPPGAGRGGCADGQVAAGEEVGDDDVEQRDLADAAGGEALERGALADVVGDDDGVPRVQIAEVAVERCLPFEREAGVGAGVEREQPFGAGPREGRHGQDLPAQRADIALARSDQGHVELPAQVREQRFDHGHAAADRRGLGRERSRCRRHVDPRHRREARMRAWPRR